MIVTKAIYLGALELRRDSKRVYWHAHRIELTLSEFEIVNLLVSRVGNDITYRQIYDAARSKDFVAGYGSDGFHSNVRSFIRRIRKKFRDVDPAFDEIKNYLRFGYRWEVPVQDQNVHVLKVV